MGKFVDLTGRRIGSFVVLSLSRRSGKDIFWNIKCDCGAVSEKRASYIQKKKKVPRFCGYNCQFNSQSIIDRNLKHGFSNHRLYGVWYNMLQRCNNKKSTSFKNYGGNGIKVCERWHDFALFAQDMEPSFVEGRQLDRIDNFGDYSQDNCRWATPRENAYNKSNNIITQDDRIKAESNGIHYNTLWHRLKSGWDKELALSKKPQCKPPQYLIEIAKNHGIDVKTLNNRLRVGIAPDVASTRQKRITKKRKE